MKTFAELFEAAIVGAVVCFICTMDYLRRAVEHERLIHEHWKEHLKLFLEDTPDEPGPRHFGG